MQTQVQSAPTADRASWSDRVKAVRDNPEARFRFACGHLPQKQAFREAAVALRGLIRAHCEDRDSVERYLALLYRFAALQSLVYARSTDHGEEAGSGDGSLLERWDRMAGVVVPYDEVGCEALPLLTKTDRKLMAQLWGEPSASTTPRAWLDGTGTDPRGATDVAAFLRGDSSLEGLEAVAQPSRRATDRAFAVDADGDTVEGPEATLADEAQEAEEAVFGLMERRRSAEGARPARSRWASRLLGLLGL